MVSHHTCDIQSELVLQHLLQLLVPQLWNRWKGTPAGELGSSSEHTVASLVAQHSAIQGSCFCKAVPCVDMDALPLMSPSHFESLEE